MSGCVLMRRTIALEIVSRKPDSALRPLSPDDCQLPAARCKPINTNVALVPHIRDSRCLPKDYLRYQLIAGTTNLPKGYLVATATYLRTFHPFVCWPPRRSARLLSRDGGADTTEPQIVVADAGIEDVAVGRAGIPGAEGPTAAPAQPSLVAAQSRPRRVKLGRSIIVAQ